MPNQQAHRLFLFNLAHDAYVEGKSSEFPTATTLSRAIRQYVFLMLLIALPMILFISLLTSFAGHRIIVLMPILLLVSLLVCAWFVIAGYWRDRKLLRSGKIVFGEVLRQDIIPAYANIGTSTITRIIYRFHTPENERKIGKIDFAHVMLRMPDGRKYPAAGTPIAVLYANDKNYKLL
jgi:hypothetical protein